MPYTRPFPSLFIIRFFFTFTRARRRISARTFARMTNKAVSPLKALYHDSVYLSRIYTQKKQRYGTIRCFSYRCFCSFLRLIRRFYKAKSAKSCAISAFLSSVIFAFTFNSRTECLALPQKISRHQRRTSQTGVSHFLRSKTGYCNLSWSYGKKIRDMA